MSENRARYPIAVMCRVLGVSPSGYYAWAKRPASERAVMDAALIVTIRVAHAASKGTYGAPRLQVDLADAGIRVGRKRVARLMLTAGLAGVSRRRHTVTTVRDGARQAPDLVDRDFTAGRPNMLWVADITYIPTWAGFLYLAVVLDAFSRRIVGWSMATTLHTQVVLDALDMALGQRRPSGVIHHSDQGSQYTSIAFGKRCREAAVRPSMGSVGDAYDNAMAESFFATLECELLDRANSRRRPRRAWPSSNSSRASTIRGGGTHRLGISPRLTTSAATTRERLIPAHTIVPPCSGPSRCGQEMAENVSTPARRPTLTAPARAGVRDVRAGTEKRTPQGPNRKTTVNRRTRCRHFRYLEPKPSPLHETGASPAARWRQQGWSTFRRRSAPKPVNYSTPIYSRHHLAHGLQAGRAKVGAIVLDRSFALTTHSKRLVTEAVTVGEKEQPLPPQIDITDRLRSGKRMIARAGEEERLVEQRSYLYILRCYGEGEKGGVYSMRAQAFDQIIRQVLVEDKPQVGIGALQQRHQPRQKIGAEGGDHAQS